MEWTEQATKDKLDNLGIAYRTYLTVDDERVLDYKWCPYRMMLRYGSIGDTCRHNTGAIVHPVTIMAARGDAWIIRDDAFVDRSGVARCHAFRVVGRDGWDGADCQVGGTLEEFTGYLDAWASMARTPGPFADGEA